MRKHEEDPHWRVTVSLHCTWEVFHSGICYTQSYKKKNITSKAPVHPETRLAVYVNILYRIGVLFVQLIQCFGSLKLLFYETGSQSG